MLLLVAETDCVRIVFLYFAGAQIIDLMMLVVDITKGIQTQTAEVHQKLN